MKGDLISRGKAIERLRKAERLYHDTLMQELSDYEEWPAVEVAIDSCMSMTIDILSKMSPEGWHKAEDGDPEPEHATEYIVRDKVGIISGRLYHPGKGWGKPGRAPSEEVAEWKEI